MLLGQLEAGFSWGLLLLTDDDSAEKIPDWASDEDQVTHGATAAIVRVMHRDEGGVTVQVWDDASGIRGGLAFAGVLHLPSGVLRVSDALGESSLRIPLGVGRVGIEIHTDSAVEATQVNLVVTAEHEEAAGDRQSPVTPPGH